MPWRDVWDIDFSVAFLHKSNN